MTGQPTLFDQPELLPTLPGKTQGIVAMRGERGDNYRFDLQCQDYYDIETPKILVLMQFKFPPCQSPRRRLCPDCHKQLCDGYGRCRGLPGMREFYD